MLVGKTSKARKGTSWAHVLRLFGRVDEDWAKTRIASGLSSGMNEIEARELGIRNFITKPYLAGKLLELIYGLLNK